MKIKQTSCRSCGGPIIWTTTRKGKKMPVDFEPVSGGKFILEPIDQMNEDSEPSAVWIGEKDKYSGERYASHFDTCPNAREKRKD